MSYTGHGEAGFFMPLTWDEPAQEEEGKDGEAACRWIKSADRKQTN